MNFADLPIGRKVALVAVLIPGVTILLAAAVMLAAQHGSFERSAREELDTLADVIALAVGDAMVGAHPSPVDAARELEALRVRTEVDEAHLFAGPELTLFASTPAGTAPPSAIIAAAPGVYESGQGLWLVAPLRDAREQPIGRVALHSSLARLNRERERSIQTVAVIAAVMLAVALGAAAMLTRSLVRPLVGVAAAMRRIEQSRDHSLRAPVASEDEIGTLAGGINGMLAALEDQARAVRESEEHMRALIESMPAAIVLLDPELGRFVLVNDASCRLFGLDRARLLEVGPLEMSPPMQPDGRSTVESGLGYIGQALAGGRPRFEWVHRDASGRNIHCDISLVALTSGARRLVCGIVVDMTERRQLEGQLRQAQKLEALGTLAGGIAHDFNNILTAILGNVEIARMEAPRGTPVHESLDEVHAAARRARDLVRRILTFSRPQDQSLRRVDPRAVVEEVARLLRATLPANVELRVQAPGDLPAILADASQVHQAVMNLATNAWQAMEGGPGRITLALNREALVSGELRPRGLEPGRYVRLDVVDTGKGIDPALLERIFEPFFTTKGAGTGTGLGLAMVHGIMKAHRGAVTLESEPGRGTTFRLFFPIAPSGAAEDDALGPAARPAGDGVRLLFVDDEAAIVRVVARSLERTGFRVTACGAPEQALVEFRRAPGAFDVVLTDLSMPGMSGLEFARAVLAERRDLPVILMSGRLTEADRQLAHELGVREVLSKPVTPDELADAVRRARVGPVVGGNGSGI